MGSRDNSPPSETRLVDCNSAPCRLSVTVTNSGSGRQALDVRVVVQQEALDDEVMEWEASSEHRHRNSGDEEEMDWE